MNNLQYLQSIIRERPCAVLLPGISIEELERRIHEYENADICWCSLGVFDMFDKHILSKINKRLTVVLDCATVPDDKLAVYETKSRKPRLQPFLERDDKNVWVTTNGLIRDAISKYTPELLKYEDKIVLIDSFFPKAEIGHWMNVPNSATFMTALLLAGRASKIVYFGLDGYNGDVSEGVWHYYQHAYIITERMYAMGSIEDPGINRDTGEFAKKYIGLRNAYRDLFLNNAPIFNCSPGTVYNVIDKVDYDQARIILCS